MQVMILLEHVAGLSHALLVRVLDVLHVLLNPLVVFQGIVPLAIADTF